MGAVELGVTIATLVVKYGIPVAVDLVKTWKDGLNGREPSRSDWEALRLADPESYFAK